MYLLILKLSQVHESTVLCNIKTEVIPVTYAPFDSQQSYLRL